MYVSHHYLSFHVNRHQKVNLRVLYQRTLRIFNFSFLSLQIKNMVVTCQEIDNCSFGSWYPRFKAVTFKSKIVPLSKEFIHYLNAESIYLPKDG